MKNPRRLAVWPPGTRDGRIGRDIRGPPHPSEFQVNERPVSYKSVGSPTSENLKRPPIA